MKVFLSRRQQRENFKRSVAYQRRIWIWAGNFWFDVQHMAENTRRRGGRDDHCTAYFQFNKIGCEQKVNLLIFVWSDCYLHTVIFLKKWANPGLILFYFRLFHITQFNKLIKALMVCWGLEPRAAGWKAQTNPLSYVGTPCINGYWRGKIYPGPLAVLLTRLVEGHCHLLGKILMW